MNKIAMQTTKASAKLPVGIRLPDAMGRLLDCGNAVEFDRAVVWKVTVAVAVVMVEVRATEDTLKVHVVSEGMPEQRDGESGIVPLYAFSAVNVSIADPLPPGLVIVIDVGLPTTVNVGGDDTTSAVEPVEFA